MGASSMSPPPLARCAGRAGGCRVLRARDIGGVSVCTRQSPHVPHSSPYSDTQQASSHLRFGSVHTFPFWQVDLGLGESKGAAEVSAAPFPINSPSLLFRRPQRLSSLGGFIWQRSSIRPGATAVAETPTLHCPWTPHARRRGPRTKVRERERTCGTNRRTPNAASAASATRHHRGWPKTPAHR